MSASPGHSTKTVVITIIVFIVIAWSGYLTIADLAGKQSQQQQQSISPVFALIERELLNPLQIATALSNVGVYDEYFLSETPDQDKLMALLKKYEDTFGLPFYLAHEKSRKQYNSDGSVFDLIEGQVFWYFTLKDETDYPVQAVLGKREDVHLYIDVREYDEQGKFTGFVGVGKSLADFIESFQQFRFQYGHEFVFVNNNDEIVLSSIPDLSPEKSSYPDDSIGIKSTQDIVWFERFTELAKDDPEPSVIVPSENGDLLVSKLTLESLNWSLYIVTPLNVRQNEVNVSFAIYIAIGLFLAVIAYKLLYHIVDVYFDRISKNKNKDELTRLANRDHARVFFNKMRKQERQVAIIIADLDDFKKLNASFGHVNGDKVIKAVSELFAEKMREDDLLVRWGGEEFAIILPYTTNEEAGSIAEELRKILERTPIQIDNQPTSITASFGHFASRQYSENIDMLIEQAYRAMFISKGRGKNFVSTINVHN